MPKTCAQAVGGPHLASTNNEWTKYSTIPYVIHNFCIQVCTPKLSQVTDMMSNFSPLSTALIMNTNQERKENLLIGSGG
jgi:hypothetical protein